MKSCFPNGDYFSLEDLDAKAAAKAVSIGLLPQFDDGGNLDEIQVLASLLSYIQGIVDDKQAASQFILTGSHQTRLFQAVEHRAANGLAKDFKNLEISRWETSTNRLWVVEDDTYVQNRWQYFDPEGLRRQ